MILASRIVGFRPHAPTKACSSSIYGAENRRRCLVCKITPPASSLGQTSALGTENGPAPQKRRARIATANRLGELQGPPEPSVSPKAPNDKGRYRPLSHAIRTGDPIVKSGGFSRPPETEIQQCAFNTLTDEQEKELWRPCGNSSVVLFYPALLR